MHGLPGESFFVSLGVQLRSTPAVIPPLNGELWIAGTYGVGAGLIGASGTGGGQQPIPNDTGLVGVPFWLQAITLGSSGAFTNVVDGVVAPR